MSKLKSNIPGIDIRGVKGRETFYLNKMIEGKTYCASAKRPLSDYPNVTAWRKSNEEWYYAWRKSLRNALEYGYRPTRVFSEAYKQYLSTARGSSVKQQTELKAAFERLSGVFLATPLKNINDSHAQWIEFKADLKIKGRKNRTINSYVELTQRILNFCEHYQDEYGLTWLDRAPRLERLKQQDEREPRVLAWERQSALLQALPAYLANPILFSLHTGLREQEVLSIRWDELQTDTRLGTYMIRKRLKNHKKFPILLNRTASSILDSLRNTFSEYVFLAPTGKPLKRLNITTWRKVVSDQKLELRIHDLRHTFAHRLRVAEVPFEDIQVLMGHATKTMTQHYAQADLLHLLECVRKIEKVTESITLRSLV